MKKSLILIFVLFFLLLVLNPNIKVYSQTPADQKDIAKMSPFPKPTIFYALPYPGILPDHPLYFLKNIRDKIVIFFRRDPVQKSQVNLLLADKNLVMGEDLWQKGQYELSIVTLEISQNYIFSSVLSLKNMELSTVPPGVIDKIKLAIQKHDEVINNLEKSENGIINIVKFNEINTITEQSKKELSLIES